MLTDNSRPHVEEKVTESSQDKSDATFESLVGTLRLGPLLEQKDPGFKDNVGGWDEGAERRWDLFKIEQQGERHSS